MTSNAKCPRGKCLVIFVTIEEKWVEIEWIAWVAKTHFRKPKCNTSSVNLALYPFNLTDL